MNLEEKQVKYRRDSSAALLVPACDGAWLTSNKNYSPLWLHVRHCLAVLRIYLCLQYVCVCASPVSSPNLHLMGDAAHAGSQVGGACWSVWRRERRETRRRRLRGVAGDWRICRGRWLACRKRDLASNRLRETGAWEDNYKYSCQRRHVSIDALEWDQPRCKEASGRGRKTGETREVGLQRAIN